MRKIDDSIAKDAKVFKKEDEAVDIKTSYIPEKGITSPSTPEIHDMSEDDKEFNKEREKEETKEPEVVSSEPPWKEIPSEPTPAEAPESCKPSPFRCMVLPFFAGLLLGGLVVGGIFYWKSKVEDETAEETPQPVFTSTPEPTPGEGEKEESTSKEEEKVDLSKYKLQALNGTGGVGVAKAVKDKLEAAGFKEVKTGNSDTFGFKETEISLKKDTPDAVYQAIKKALEDKYSLLKKDEAVDTKSGFDVLIVVGEIKK